MAQVEAINAKDALLRLTLLVKLGHVPLLKIAASDESE